MKALVLTLDRLSLRCLSPYGNEWIETPNFDRLAAGSIVFDQHFGENFDPAAVNHAWWTGCYQFPRTAEQQRSLPPFTDSLRQSGVRTCLVAEKSALESTGKLPTFDQIIELKGRGGVPPPLSPASQGGDAEEEPPFVQLVTRGVECLTELQSSGNDSWLLWLKSGGVFSPESGDKSPEADEDLRDSYAEAVMDIDRPLGKLLDAVDAQLGTDDLLFIMTAGIGESLGERSVVGREDGPLREEIVHTPLLIQCSQVEMGSRRQELVQTVDLAPTLLEWFQSRSASGPLGDALEGRSLLPPIRDEPVEWRDCAFLGEGLRASGVRSETFYLVKQAGDAQSDDGELRSLFVKPDDLWDGLDVAEQSPDTVHELEAKLKAFLTRHRNGAD